MPVVHSFLMGHVQLDSSSFNPTVEAKNSRDDNTAPPYLRFRSGYRRRSCLLKFAFILPNHRVLMLIRALSLRRTSMHEYHHEPLMWQGSPHFQRGAPSPTGLRCAVFCASFDRTSHQSGITRQSSDSNENEPHFFEKKTRAQEQGRS